MNHRVQFRCVVVSLVLSLIAGACARPDDKSVSPSVTTKSSDASPEVQGENSASAPEENLIATCPIGNGQCTVAMQNFFTELGVTVGQTAGAPDVGDCKELGACQLWVRDIPSQYGWVRTDRPTALDIVIFPPHAADAYGSENGYGHAAIVHHVDAGGVWLIDSNDNFDEQGTNTPHLHPRQPYGYYHFTNVALLAKCLAPSVAR